MAEKMSKGSRYELISRTGPRYRNATSRDRKRILDEFIAASGYSRKHAIYVLSQTKVKEPTKRNRAAVYGLEEQNALIELWEYANRICSKRLVPFLPDLIDAVSRHGRLILKESVKAKLLSMSPATVDRLLKARRRCEGQTCTRPGSLLRKHVPIRTFADWNEVQPGFLEADLVAHCGDTTSGQFLQTLVATDINTGWTEPFCLLHKGEQNVIAALTQIRPLLPFAIQGLDTDNGSEFMNYGLIQYCEDNQITFTRSRPYKKNDQCHVEEKNGAIVRRVVGYHRYEGAAAQDAFNRLYSVLRLYVNFFQPSMKLIYKERHDARVRKKYDRAQTPYKRVLQSGILTKEKEQQLRQSYLELDPTDLLLSIEQLQEDLMKHSAGYDDTQKVFVQEIKGKKVTDDSTNRRARIRIKRKRPRRSRNVTVGSVATDTSVASENIQRIAGESPSFRQKRIAMEGLLRIHLEDR